MSLHTILHVHLHRYNPRPVIDRVIKFVENIFKFDFIHNVDPWDVGECVVSPIIIFEDKWQTHVN